MINSAQGCLIDKAFITPQLQSVHQHANATSSEYQSLLPSGTSSSRWHPGICLILETGDVAEWSLLTRYLGAAGDDVTLTWSELDQVVAGSRLRPPGIGLGGVVTAHMSTRGDRPALLSLISGWASGFPSCASPIRREPHPTSYAISGPRRLHLEVMLPGHPGSPRPSPSAQRAASAKRVRVGDEVSIDVAAKWQGQNYVTEVRRRGRLVIGVVVPQNSEIRSVRLDGERVDATLVRTARGLEVRVSAGRGSGVAKLGVTVR